MSDVILGIIIGSIITIGTFTVTQIFDYFRLKSEERRWYSEYFLNLKIENLQDMHQKLEDCTNIFLYKWGFLEKFTIDDIKKQLEPFVIEYMNAVKKAMIYLDRKGKDKIFGTVANSGV